MTTPFGVETVKSKKPKAIITSETKASEQKEAKLPVIDTEPVQVPKAVEPVADTSKPAPSAVEEPRNDDDHDDDEAPIAETTAQGEEIDVDDLPEDADLS